MSDRMDEAGEWLQERRSAGFSDEEIRAALVQRGWSAERIDDLMGAEPAPPPPRRGEAAGQERSGLPTAVIILAVAGCGLMALAVLAIMGAILFPVFGRAREKARQASCLANLKQIGVAQLMYSQDHEQTLPDAAVWPETTERYIHNRDVYLCPADEPPSIPRPWPMSYTMNPRVSRTSLTEVADPSRLPLCFDGTTLSGGSEVAAFRHNGGPNCSYVDGHVKWVAGASWDSQWEPAP